MALNDLLQPLKENKELNKEGLSLSKQLSAENLYRTIAVAMFVFMVVLAFFISLADADFEWVAIGTAKFWIDFSVTFGGGQFLKFVFGKYGNVIGHKNEKVIEAIDNIESDNLEIKNRGLVTLLDDFVNFNNYTRKIRAIRKRVFAKLNLPLSRKSKWRRQKEAVIIYEKYLASEEGSQLNKELSEKLDDMNFDIDGYNVKYNKIKKASLTTGFNSGKDESDENMTYSELYELFGRSSMITAVSILASLLLAVSSITSQDITLATFITFFTRIFMYALNSFIGFGTGKSAVERVKLNILVNIHNFLQKFLEANKKPMGSLNKIVFPREQTEVLV